MSPNKATTVAMIRKFALTHDGADEGVACAGTALECLTFKVRKKAFLFASAKADTLQLRLKLNESLQEARALAAKKPGQFEAGKTGWAKLTFAQDAPPPQELLKRWIAESYRLFAPKKSGG